MAFFQSLLSSEFTASLTVLGSSLVIDREKLERKLGGLYLSGLLYLSLISSILGYEVLLLLPLLPLLQMIQILHHPAQALFSQVRLALVGIPIWTHLLPL
jgi:hypothetical protein